MDHPPPSIVFRGTRCKVREDVQNGDLWVGETGVHGRGNGDPGSGAGVWAAPGQTQCDFGQAKAVTGGVERKMHYSVLDLTRSDGCFVIAYPAETTETFGRLPRHPLAEQATGHAVGPL